MMTNHSGDDACVKGAQVAQQSSLFWNHPRQVPSAVARTILSSDEEDSTAGMTYV
jgi:hypothetical protein